MVMKPSVSILYKIHDLHLKSIFFYQQPILNNLDHHAHDITLIEVHHATCDVPKGDDTPRSEF